MKSFFEPLAGLTSNQFWMDFKIFWLQKKTDSIALIKNSSLFLYKMIIILERFLISGELYRVASGIYVSPVEDKIV